MQQLIKTNENGPGMQTDPELSAAGAGRRRRRAFGGSRAGTVCGVVVGRRHGRAAVSSYARTTKNRSYMKYFPHKFTSLIKWGHGSGSTGAARAVT